MNDILWQFPVPLTGLIRGPRFEILPKRQCEISFSIEAKDGSEKWISLLFSGVEVYKCTYLTSLGSVPQDLRTEAYGKLIAVTNSHWLDEVNKYFQEYHKAMPTKPQPLQHMMINFDDGPCYELICTSFKLLENQVNRS